MAHSHQPPRLLLTSKHRAIRLFRSSAAPTIGQFFAIILFWNTLHILAPVQVLRYSLTYRRLQVYPINDYPEEELCIVSRELLQQHVNQARNTRILMQVSIQIK